MSVPYPSIDPVLVHIGPLDLPWYGPMSLEIRWYGVMYLLAFAVAYFVIRSELRRRKGPIPEEATDDFLFHLILGILLGGRIGYVLFYNLPVYVSAPWEVLALWNGGMSFHGGLIGMIISGWMFGRRHHAPFLELADIGALAAPPGLMLGRLGNFINGELYGRVTTLPWGMVFPTGGNLPRHPSQLYESFLEGPVLFLLLWWLRRKTRTSGELLATFLVGYGMCRFTVEFVRQPDPQLGFVFYGLTMGQILCLFMIAFGIGMFVYLRLRSPHAG
jgi:phosphatidylglycerol---prolipoprotein diacylglyceryl transferase